MSSWSTQQLVEFLARISSCTDEQSAIRNAVEHAAESLDAAAAAIVSGNRCLASTGFPARRVPRLELIAVAEGRAEEIAVPGIGRCATLSVSLSEEQRGSLVVARDAREPFDHDDMSMLRGMARVLMLTIRQLRLIESERYLREQSQREVAERRAVQQKLAHHALHDGLTGLPNRTLLLDHLGRALRRARERDTLLAALFVDLDNFKLINDTLGHQVGDDLLRLVAARLLEGMRTEVHSTSSEGDMVARFGGDEFVLIAEGLHVHDDAAAIAQRITNSFSSAFAIGDEELFVSASVGVAVSSDASTPNGLIRDADAAMYHAKQRGRARFELFDDRMREQLVNRLNAEKDLRRALDSSQFRVHYQPIVALEDGMIMGAEALLRWQHPEKGLLAPAEFIPLAEESGLIVDIGEWVLRDVCRQLAEWRRGGIVAPGMTVSVNVSARQLDDEGVLMARLSQALVDTGADPSALGLELTESVLIENRESPVELLERLGELGATLILDDFGTGYSSLSYLQRLPLDVLKLDRSFVAGLERPGRDPELVRALIQMAGVLGLSVVVEGVENEAQLDCLKRLGCQAAQGYLLGRPMPATAFAELVRARRAYAASDLGAGSRDLARSDLAASGLAASGLAPSDPVTSDPVTSDPVTSGLGAGSRDLAPVSYAAAARRS